MWKLPLLGHVPWNYISSMCQNLKIKNLNITKSGGRRFLLCQLSQLMTVTRHNFQSYKAEILYNDEEYTL
jgi:hypothetical protein